MNVNDASRPKNFKKPKFASHQKFHEQNRQWNNPHISMAFPSYEAPLHVPWEFYFLTYQCRLHHMEHLYMCHRNFILIYIILILHGLIIRICRFLIDIFVQIILHIKNRQLKSHHQPTMTVLIIKNRSVQRKKHKMTKHVYRVKKDERLTKNSDLTLDK